VQTPCHPRGAVIRVSRVRLLDDNAGFAADASPHVPAIATGGRAGGLGDCRFGRRGRRDPDAPTAGERGEGGCCAPTRTPSAMRRWAPSTPLRLPTSLLGGEVPEYRNRCPSIRPRRLCRFFSIYRPPCIWDQKRVQKRSFSNKKRKKPKKAKSFALPILTSARQIASGARKTAIRTLKGADSPVFGAGDFTRIYKRNASRPARPSAPRRRRRNSTRGGKAGGWGQRETVPPRSWHYYRVRGGSPHPPRV